MRGDIAYVKDNYVFSGKCRIQSTPSKHSRSYIVLFEEIGKVVSCPSDAFDLELTFGK